MAKLEVSGMGKDPPMFLRVQDVMKLMSCSKSKAYLVIRHLNQELEKKGFLTVGGRISRQYFEERYLGSTKA